MIFFLQPIEELEGHEVQMGALAIGHELTVIIALPVLETIPMKPPWAVPGDCVR